MSALSSARRDWFAAVEAAEELLTRVYRIDVRKVLDPTNPHDFLVIQRRLGDALAGLTKAQEAKALSEALGVLDVDWTSISAAQRAKVIEAARQSIKAVPLAAKKQIETTVAAAGKEVITATKKKTADKFSLSIDTDFSQADETITKHAGKSMAHYVTNAYGVRSQEFSAKARGIVTAGIADGLDRHEIGKDLHAALGQSLARSPSYFTMAAGVHINRSRSYATLASYEASAIEYFAFEAVLDAVTTLQCRLMHGRRFAVRKAIEKFHEVAASDDPEDVKHIQPWLSVGKDQDGTQHIYTKDQSGARTRVATVQQSAMGQNDETGTFALHHSNAKLEAMGVTTPPLHGNCRSTIVPSGLEDTTSEPIAPVLPLRPFVTPEVKQRALARLDEFDISPTCACPVEYVESNVEYLVKVWKAKKPGCECAPEEVYSYFGKKTQELEGGVYAPTWPVPEPKTIKYLQKPTTTNKTFADVGAGNILTAVKNTVDKKKVADLIASADADGTMGGSKLKIPIAVKYNDVYYIVHGHEHAQAQYLLQHGDQAATEPVIKVQVLDYDVKVHVPKPKKPPKVVSALAPAAPPPPIVITPAAANAGWKNGITGAVQSPLVPPPAGWSKGGDGAWYPPQPAKPLNPIPKTAAPTPTTSPLLDKHAAIEWTTKTPKHADEMLNGVKLSPTTPGFWKPENGHVEVVIPGEPPMPKQVGNLKPASGCVIIEPDGRMWIVSPSGSYGGYNNTYPKGKVDAGLTPQQNAKKEAFEESGLEVEIIGHLGDFVGETSNTRYYIARRKGGAPWGAHFESSAVKLVPIEGEQTDKLFNKDRDKKILEAVRAHVAKPPLTLADITTKEISGQQGSNPGGIYEGSDGVKRYVKFYKDDAQAIGEHLSNKIYEGLGLGALQSVVVPGKAGRLVYASELVEGKTLTAAGLTEAHAKEALKGFVADVLTMNWDAAGLNHDNMMVVPGGVLRIDNGASFLTRAQGERKPKDELGSASEWTGFFDPHKNPAYAKLAAKAGVSSPEDMKPELIAGIRAVKAMERRVGGWQAFVDKNAAGLGAADKASIVRMLDARTKFLNDRLKEMQPRPGTVSELEHKTKHEVVAEYSKDEMSRDSYWYQSNKDKLKALCPPRTSSDGYSAMRSFTAGGYGPMRRGAISGKTALTDGLSSTEKENFAKAALYDAWLAKASPLNPGATLLRGVKDLPVEYVEKHLTEDHIRICAPVSTTRLQSVADSFGHGYNSGTLDILYVIKNHKTGVCVEHVTSTTGEGEIAMRSGRYLKILEAHREQGNDRRVIVTCEETDHDDSNPPEGKKPHEFLRL